MYTFNYLCVRNLNFILSEKNSIDNNMNVEEIIDDGKISLHVSSKWVENQLWHFFFDIKSVAIENVNESQIKI